jgi:hypothetical protein
MLVETAAELSCSVAPADMATWAPSLEVVKSVPVGSFSSQASRPRRGDGEQENTGKTGH